MAAPYCFMIGIKGFNCHSERSEESYMRSNYIWEYVQIKQ